MKRIFPVNIPEPSNLAVPDSRLKSFEATCAGAMMSVAQKSELLLRKCYVYFKNYRGGNGGDLLRILHTLPFFCCTLTSPLKMS